MARIRNAIFSTVVSIRLSLNGVVSLHQMNAHDGEQLRAKGHERKGKVLFGVVGPPLSGRLAPISVQCLVFSVKTREGFSIHFVTCLSSSDLTLDTQHLRPLRALSTQHSLLSTKLCSASRDPTNDSRDAGRVHYRLSGLGE